ncbi:terminase small subunit [Bradyrhizobium oligotrophicum]|uniref:terminase small subunit n=1 Tax=Bradyrhizobium oligotrophicum TaxID=44255 RepID=UPI003EBCD33E
MTKAATTKRTSAPLEDAKLGPAMAELNERQRNFVYFYFNAPRKLGAATYAAKAAGYGTATSSRHAFTQIGHRLLSAEKVQLAIQEETAKYVTALGPLAVRQLARLISNPNAKDHARGIGMVLDRVTPAESTLTVRHEGEVKLSNSETMAILKRIDELAARFAVPLPAPKIIEGEKVG